MKRKWIVSLAAGFGIGILLGSALAPKQAQAGVFPVAQGCNHDGVCGSYLGVRNSMPTLFVESKASCPSDCH